MRVRREHSALKLKEPPTREAYFFATITSKHLTITDNVDIIYTERGLNVMDNIRDVVDTIATVGGFIGSIQAIAAAVKWFVKLVREHRRR